AGVGRVGQHRDLEGGLALEGRWWRLPRAWRHRQGREGGEGTGGRGSRYHRDLQGWRDLEGWPWRLPRTRWRRQGRGDRSGGTECVADYAASSPLGRGTLGVADCATGPTLRRAAARDGSDQPAQRSD